MDGAMESAFEILAVVIFYLISYGLERKKKKEQGEQTLEEVLEETGIEFPDPVEIEFESTSIPQVETLGQPLEASPPPRKTKEVDHWRTVTDGFQMVNSRALTMAQDYGRLASLRTFVRDLEAGIRGTIRRHLKELDERREQWGDERVAQDARAIQQSLLEICAHAERLGKLREHKDEEWRRWDELASELYAPIRRVFHQMGDEDNWKDVMVVPENFPSSSFQTIIPNWGWVRVPGIGPGWSMSLARSVSGDLILRNRSFFLEAMERIPGDPSGRTLEHDGSIRESGINNWVSTWMGTLIQDTFCCLMMGPAYLTRLEMEGARNSDSRDTITIPGEQHATMPPGVFRESWVRGLLTDLFFMEKVPEENIYLEILDVGFDGQIPASAFYEALHEARKILTKTPLKSLGGGKLLQVTGLALDRTQWGEAERWLATGPPKELHKNLWRSWFAGSMLVMHPEEQKRWWSSILPGQRHLARRGSGTHQTTSEMWTQGIQDRALFLAPRGKKQSRRASSVSL